MFCAGIRSYEDLLTLYSEDQICFVYGIPIGESICSPLPGRQDKTPSFKARKTDDGKIVWRDFYYPPGQQPTGDVKNLIMLLEGVDEHELVKRLMPKMKGTPLTYNSPTPRIISAGIEFAKYWHEWEKKYWEEGLDMNSAFLMKNDTYPCRELIGDDHVIWRSTEKAPTYVHIVDIANNIWQAYRPKNPKGKKHWSWNTERVLFGTKHIKHNQHVIFTSSNKDRMAVIKTGYQSVCYGGEAIVPDEAFARRTLEKFNGNAYAYMNNDATGIMVAELYKKLGFRIIVNPPDQPKDPSDFIMKHQSYSQLHYLIKSQM